MRLNSQAEWRGDLLDEGALFINLFQVQEKNEYFKKSLLLLDCCLLIDINASVQNG
jgi:hypothetical protein